MKSNYKSIFKSEYQDISYVNENNEIETLIFGGDESPEMLARFKFDSLPNSTPRIVSTSALQASSFESELIKLLTNASDRMKNIIDRNFNTTSGYEFRAIPIISGNQKKVIVYSKPIKKLNHVLLGNDYELLYDSTAEFKSIKKFHARTTKIPLSSVLGMVTDHEHETSDEISATDVCSLLLPKDRIRW